MTVPIKRAGPLTYLTITILVLFGITDLAAEVTGDGTGRYGETFSTWIAHLDGKHWWFRALIGVVTVVLATHLTVQIP